MRALFDQSAAFDHALLRELRPIIDRAQDHGIAVSVNIAGTLPAVDDATARRLAGLIEPALTAASSSIRITASGRPSAVELSAVCRGVRDTEIFTKMTGTSEDQLALTIVDDTVWITAHHHLEGGSTYALAGHAN